MQYAVYGVDFGSSDLEDEFFALYARCEAALQTLLATRNPIAILSGEGMVALWGALKSVIRPGDRVLAIATGVFGHGFAEMAQQIGALVEVIDFGYDAILDADRVREVAQRFGPKLITVVHCETPSGTLNPLAEVGQICREVDALYLVDFVASAGGTPVLVDEWHIDLGLLGSQKVLSLMPDLAMVTVSEKAWVAIAATGYVGYDALAPWRCAVKDRYLPYTHNWQAMAGLEAGLQLLNREGLANVQARHAAVAQQCRAGLAQLGIDLWPKQEAYCAPTVTAARIPRGLAWDDLDTGLRARGMVVGGSYGPLAGKVFRIGHMGAQADVQLVQQGLDTLKELLDTVRR